MSNESISRDSNGFYSIPSVQLGMPELPGTTLKNLLASIRSNTMGGACLCRVLQGDCRAEAVGKFYIGQISGQYVGKL